MFVAAMNLDRDGAERHHGAATSCLNDLKIMLRDRDAGRAGTRLWGLPGLADLLAGSGLIGQIANTHLPGARPVRAILFDKSVAANWTLGWHQDRTIAVTARVEVDGFGAWTRKQGLLHVEPPFAIIARMVTLRVHLDPVDTDNAPLLIAPGSYRLGRIAEAQIQATVEACGTTACLADRGDIWAYSTPILHASARAGIPRRRRVLQVDYSAGDLPHGLAWLRL
jgi:hypothetical protein